MPPIASTSRATGGAYVTYPDDDARCEVCQFPAAWLVLDKLQLCNLHAELIGDMLRRMVRL